ncbi:DUF421 domain-containing protein [Phenylobacterium sp.]|uniref:DUF421 domain-containing protein n=1 Tax=Phenylobacterium sp. TaxID=1871053 RepID=UPI0035B3F81E
MDGAFFTNWNDIGRVLAVGAAAYVSLVLILRISGKRTLSKLNAFDFVVTIALGSTLASVLTSKTLSLAEGVTALALLVGLQLVVTSLAVRSRRFDRIVKSEPSLLLRNGELLSDAMRRERVTPDEVMSAIRDAGATTFAAASAVILESDGTLTALLADARSPGA